MATSTLGSGTLVLAGTTSGTTTVTATAVAGTTTLTLPAATDTLVGRATTDTLTNKTLTGAVMNGTLGATTPSTVAATTISASSTATFAAGAAGTPSITTTGDTNTGIFFPAADTIAFAEGGVESMRIDASNRLLIGATTSGSATGVMQTISNASSAYTQYNRGTSGGGVVGTEGTGLVFYTYTGSLGSETYSQRATIDSSGNLGLGVTPSAWSLGKAIEVGYVGHGIWGNATNETILMTNAYYNSGWKYSANSQYATQYAQRDGQHAFYNAPQGGGSSIGTAITWTQAMTLNASGYLGVGDTSPTTRLSIGGSSTALLASQTSTYAPSANSASTSFKIFNDSATNDAYASLEFWVRNVNSNINIAYIASPSISTSDVGTLTFGRRTGSATSAESMRIDSSGNLLVGTTTALGLVTVARSTASSYNYASNAISNQPDHMGFFNGGTNTGSIQRNGGSGVSYVTTSDYRLKENIAPMTGALAKVTKLKPVTYTWKLDGSEGQGFIAHELAEVVPDCVAGDKDAVNEDGSIKPQGIDTSFLVATLTAAIQELKAEFDAYKASHP